jgi:arylsulfatase A-like enzyme
MHNTLVGHGPDFKKGFVNYTPSGNVDVAPTILWLLGLNPPSHMDGRVLHEALVNSNEPVPETKTETLEATRDIGNFHWRQYIKVRTVGKTRYFDEGSSEVTHP